MTQIQIILRGLARLALPALYVIAITLLTVWTPHRAQAQSLDNSFQAQPRENDPTGAWTYTVTETKTGKIIRGTALFTKDGGMIGSIQGEGACCPIVTPGYGVWTRTGQHTLAVTFKAILYDDQGTLVGIGTGRQSITLNSSRELVGRGVFTITAPDGAVTVTPEVTFVGERVRVEPLP
jgi:hypothetical protein